MLRQTAPDQPVNLINEASVIILSHPQVTFPGFSNLSQWVICIPQPWKHQKSIFASHGESMGGCRKLAVRGFIEIFYLHLLC